MSLQEKLYQICMNCSGDIYFNTLTSELKAKWGLKQDLRSCADFHALNDIQAQAALEALHRHMSMPVTHDIVFRIMRG